jgi:arylsulfatase A-like enzyme
MKNMVFSKRIFFAGCLPMAFTNVISQESISKPNIVFILADDMGWKDLTCYGNTFNETPNIDSLSRAGMRFTQAYSAGPVSSPTRASILTGKYPATLKLTNSIGVNKTDSNSSVLPAKWKPFLEPSEITLAEILKTNGYTTGMIGTWHLGWGKSMQPWDQGFDYTRLIDKNASDYYNYSIISNAYKPEFTDHGTEYLTDKLTTYGVEFIKQNQEKPFFLYLAYTAPHVLLVPRADKISKYLLKCGYNGTKAGNPYYAAMMESLDEGVGRIVETLRAAGLLENTIIVVTSDHGGVGIAEMGPVPTSNIPLRKWKGFLYEGGIRVPSIISWKSKIGTGIVSDHYFSSIDYLPTLCDLVGIKGIPDSIAGKSIVPILFQIQPANIQQDTIFWHYPHFSNQGSGPAGAVRCGDYKLIENYETHALELYNLKNDLGELHDLSKIEKKKTLEMYEMLDYWRKKNKAEMPIPKKNQFK